MDLILFTYCNKLRKISENAPL